MGIERFWRQPGRSAVLLLALLGTSACHKEQPGAQSAEAYAENAKRAYDEAIEAYLERDWELAQQLFNNLTRNYGYSRYARLAQLRLADIQFHQDNFLEAVGDYKAFTRDFPNDPEVRYARFRTSQAQFAQASDGFLSPPLEERELDSVRDAFASLNAYMADYPNDGRQVELDYMLEVVTGLLVRHELYVARFYLRQDEFEAAVARCQYALDHYPGSDLDAEALVLLGETYLMMKERRKAYNAFNRVLKEHTDSAFVVPAKEFLERMGPVTAKAAPAKAQGLPEAAN